MVKISLDPHYMHLSTWHKCNVMIYYEVLWSTRYWFFASAIVSFSIFMAFFLSMFMILIVYMILIIFVSRTEFSWSISRCLFSNGRGKSPFNLFFAWLYFYGYYVSIIHFILLRCSINVIWFYACIKAAVKLPFCLKCFTFFELWLFIYLL